MEKRRIGSLEVSVVGLGCNNFGGRLDQDRTTAVVNAALEKGITFLDTADIYGGTLSETMLGLALEGRRNDVVIATKFGMKVDDERQGADPAYVRRACDDSLARLATDHIDLYFLHQPDPSTHIAETLSAMHELVEAGKVLEIGCSNFSVDQLREADDAVANGATKFVSVQNEYSMLRRAPELGVLEECEANGLAFLPYFPLASGLLTGKYKRGEGAPEGTRLANYPPAYRDQFLNDDNLGAVEALTEFAEAHGHTILELAFAWLLAKPVISSVIAGATSVEQIHANSGAVGWTLTADELAEVDKMLPAPVSA